MNELKGKRLLIMSGSVAACEIVKEAHDLGVEVYATDYYETSPVKEISDKSFNVSTADVDAVVKLCSDERIDGIFSGYTDSVLPYMQQVAVRLGIPFWGNESNIAMCIDKLQFKQACEKAGVKTVPYILVREGEFDEKTMTMDYPVVVKPVDNSGSRGVYKVYDPKDLRKYYDKALSFSQKKEVLIEKLMPVEREFSAYYLVGGGILCAMGDRYVDVVDESTAPQPKGMFFPSVRLNRYLRTTNDAVLRLFEQNDMHKGFAFVQGFECDGEFYIHEIGYRLNGGFTYKFTEYYNGLNIPRELIRFSLTGKMEKSEISKADPHFNGFGLLITVGLNEGVIGEIRGIEEIRKHPNIIDFIPQHKVGDSLMAHGTSAQIFGYGFCIAQTREELVEAVDYVREHLIVKDTDNNNMLVGIIDANSVRMT